MTCEYIFRRPDLGARLDFHCDWVDVRSGKPHRIFA